MVTRCRSSSPHTSSPPVTSASTVVPATRDSRTEPVILEQAVLQSFRRPFAADHHRALDILGVHDVIHLPGAQHPPLLDDHHGVTHFRQLGEDVRADENGLPLIGEHFQQFAQFDAGPRIDALAGSSSTSTGGSAHERPGQADPLLHSLGQVVQKLAIDARQVGEFLDAFDQGIAVHAVKPYARAKKSRYSCTVMSRCVGSVSGMKPTSPRAFSGSSTTDTPSIVAFSSVGSSSVARMRIVVVLPARRWDRRTPRYGRKTS